MRALIIDTETTGFNDPQVIQLAYMGPVASVWPDESTTTLHFRPSVPIQLGALATHHILEEDLSEAPPWAGAWSLPIGTDFIVGHNVDYDWRAIGSPDVCRICTLALARRLWPEFDSHTLGALTYAFAGDRRVAREELRGAHHAARDVELCCRLIFAIVSKLQIDSWLALWEASEVARVPTHFDFGKYDGRPIEEIRRIDRGYIQWCMTKCDRSEDPYFMKAMRGES